MPCWRLAGAPRQTEPQQRIPLARVPGSVREEAKYPEPPSGPGAVDGTHCTPCWSTASRATATRQDGRHQAQDHEGEFVVDRARADRVAQALTYARQRARVPRGHACRDQGAARAPLGRDDMSGTCDIQIQDPEVLEIIDYKDGMNEVVAADNPQLELYALGVLAGFKLPVNGDYGFQRVRMTIIQPKLALKGVPIITSHEVDNPRDHGQDWQVRRRALQPRTIPTHPWCPGVIAKYCKHKSCSTRAGDVIKEMGMSFPCFVLNQPGGTKSLTRLPSCRSRRQTSTPTP